MVVVDEALGAVVDEPAGLVVDEPAGLVVVDEPAALVVVDSSGSVDGLVVDVSTAAGLGYEGTSSPSGGVTNTMIAPLVTNKMSSEVHSPGMYRLPLVGNCIMPVPSRRISS